MVDPVDPALAAKASMIGLIDLVESALLKILQALDHMVRSGLKLLGDIAAAMDDILLIGLSLGPVFDNLYTWMQKPAPGAAAEKPTLIGVACLVAGFAVTVALKLINGVDFVPFPDGRFPALPAPSWPAPASRPGTGTGTRSSPS